MCKPVAALLIAVFILSSIVVFQPVSASVIEIVVPDDFPTINQALQNATDGDTILVRQGMYNETIIIDKAITLRGEDTNNTIINGNSTGTVIQIVHDNVTVTGLTVTYSLAPNTPRRYYQHDWPSDWIGQNGWSALGYPRDSGCFVRRTEFKLAGIHLQNAKNCNLTGNKISDCGVGMWLWKSSKNTVTGNVLVGNDYGLQVDSSGNNSVVGNTFLDNGGGIWLPQPNWVSGWGVNRLTVGNTFAQNNFIGNQGAVEPQCLTNTTNYWDSGSVGNYWSDYNGTDFDGDGVSDKPYQIMGEYYTGGWRQTGVWLEQVYGVDNYPLMAPFNTTSMFAVYNQEPKPQDPTLNLAQPAQTAAAIAAAAVFVAAIVAVAVYIVKRRR